MKRIIIILVFSCLCNKAQTIYTFAGSNTQGFSGDGGLAVNAELDGPSGIALDASGNVFISDSYNSRIRMVTPQGIITTFAGSGSIGFSGDGALAINAELHFPASLIFDASGNLYFSDSGNNKIRKINNLGIITTIAGTGLNGFGGDGGLATNAALNNPTGITFDSSGNLFICDVSNNRIRKINSSGTITTFAGNGFQGFGGDGGQAVNASLNQPQGIVFDASGNAYISDNQNHRIRKVDPSGLISTYAGTGAPAYSGDGGNAINAELYLPQGLVIDALGNLYFADSGTNRVRKISPSGIITNYIGGGTTIGDGGPPANASILSPGDMIIGPSGNFYITTPGHYRVRELCNTSCLAGIETIEVNNSEFTLFPNPSKKIFNLKFGDMVENCVLTINNSVGQTLYEQKINKGIQQIELKNLASGIYYFNIIKDNKSIKSGKISLIED